METDQLSVDVTDQASIQTEDDVEVIEITISSPEPERTAEKDPAIDITSPQLANNSPQVKKESESTSLLAEIYRRGGFAFSSSGSDVSVGAYCARKVEALSPKEKESGTDIPFTLPKVSISEPICLAATIPPFSPVTERGKQKQRDISLPTPPIHFNIRDRWQGGKYPKSKVTIEAPVIEFSFAPALEHPVVRGASSSSHIDHQSKALSEEEMPTSGGETCEHAVSDLESVKHKRSILADAFSAPVRNFAPLLSEGSSYLSSDEAIQRSGGPAPLSIKSQELIRTDFEKAHPYSLAQGHPTSSLNQSKSPILRSLVVVGRI